MMRLKELKFFILEDVRVGMLAIQLENLSERDQFLKLESQFKIDKKDYKAAIVVERDDLVRIDLPVIDAGTGLTIDQSLRDALIQHLKKKKYEYDFEKEIPLEVVPAPLAQPAPTPPPEDDIPPAELNALRKKMWQLKRLYHKALQYLNRGVEIFDEGINEGKQFYSENLRPLVAELKGLFTSPGQHPGALALAIATMYVGLFSGLSILTYSLLGSAFVYATSKLRNYVYERALEEMPPPVEAVVAQAGAEAISETELAFEDGLKASKSWTLYFNSCFSSRDWRHPLAFGAGLMHGYHSSEEVAQEDRVEVDQRARL